METDTNKTNGAADTTAAPEAAGKQTRKRFDMADVLEAMNQIDGGMITSESLAEKLGTSNLTALKKIHEAVEDGYVTVLKQRPLIVRFTVADCAATVAKLRESSAKTKKVTERTSHMPEFEGRMEFEAYRSFMADLSESAELLAKLADKLVSMVEVMNKVTE